MSRRAKARPAAGAPPRGRPQPHPARRTAPARARWAVACADADGSFWDESEWEGAARIGTRFRPPDDEELVPIPPGSVVQYLPGRVPLAWRHSETGATPKTG